MFEKLAFFNLSNSTPHSILQLLHQFNDTIFFFKETKERKSTLPGPSLQTSSL